MNYNLNNFCVKINKSHYNRSQSIIMVFCESLFLQLTFVLISCLLQLLRITIYKFIFFVSIFPIHWSSTFQFTVCFCMNGGRGNKLREELGREIEWLLNQIKLNHLPIFNSLILLPKLNPLPSFTPPPPPPPCSSVYPFTQYTPSLSQFHYNRHSPSSYSRTPNSTIK